MFGRKHGAVETVTGNARSVRDYVDPLLRDEKLRKKVLAALVVGNEAQRRARSQAGLVGLARRLATDPVLRAQLLELGDQLQGVQARAKKAHSNKVRNTVLVVVGLGIAGAAAWKLTKGGDEYPSTWQPPQPQDGVQAFADDVQPVT